MPTSVVVRRIARWTVLVGTVVAVACLAYVARRQDRAKLIPEPWRPWVILVVVVLIGATCTVVFRTLSRPNAPIGVIAVLSAISFVLGLSSYWTCSGTQKPSFVTKLIWTATLLKGGVDDRKLDEITCPTVTPVALDVARLGALSAVFLGVLLVLIKVMETQSGRFRILRAKTVTVIIEMDENAQSMVSALAKDLDRGELLVLLTSAPDRPCVTECRGDGLCIATVDVDRQAALESLTVWPKLSRLYLLSSDAVANLNRLEMVSEVVAKARVPILARVRLLVRGIFVLPPKLTTARAVRAVVRGVNAKRRLPLLVRIDDPWQAEAWRQAYKRNSQVLWAPGAVSIYEATAARLLDSIVGRATEVFVCGTSRLTLALCADLDHRHCAASEKSAEGLPAMTVLGRKAEDFVNDHRDHEAQLHECARARILAVPEAPSVSRIARMIDDSKLSVESLAVIIVDSINNPNEDIDSTLGIRLATRYPSLPIYQWDSDVRSIRHRRPIVGGLTTFPLAMDMPGGRPQDALDRAAILIHENYRATADPDAPTSKPWDQLSAFYRRSNRRLVRNVLQIVEQIGDHSWNSMENDTVLPDPPGSGDASPLEQLRRLGFPREVAMQMAQAEHEDWCEYLRAEGWHEGPRDDAHKKHPLLIPWDRIASDEKKLTKAVGSVAGTVLQLRQQGYRSWPVWRRYRRIGDVQAERRNEPWTWTTRAGDVMQARAGDWAVTGADGGQWSVQDGIFQESYEPGAGGTWKRKGSVLARRCVPGESVRTLEGAGTATDESWVVQGDRGERWIVPEDEFRVGYEGPLFGE
ncbi:RyR domain-containing protein [Smaragdicoccus niigatensis]|uniref:RyR domain-containing protein n=1 Tax=Smaragdicoccus niigatensis TaxID=359359 RepID=UPI00036512E3|nr:RyR domain-containing protein [Smaragdicoccus niigatensis]